MILHSFLRCLSSLEKAHYHESEETNQMSPQDSDTDMHRASESLKQVLINTLIVCSIFACFKYFFKFQIVNAAYQVQLNVKSSASFVHSLWERLNQFLRSLTLPSPGTMSSSNSGSGSWSMSSGQNPMTPTEWKTQVAIELLDSLSDSRLARVICSQVQCLTRSLSSFKFFFFLL